MSLDFGKGYLRVRQPITVTLTVPATRTTPAQPYQVAYCHFGMLSEEDIIKANGVLTATDRAFSMWSDNLPGGVVPLRDYDITDPSGTVYSIHAVETRSRGNRYRCLCKRTNG